MENYDIYTSTTNREYKEQAEKAMKMYYDTFDEIETVRVSPRLQYVKKRLKQKRTSGGGDGVNECLFNIHVTTTQHLAAGNYVNVNITPPGITKSTRTSVLSGVILLYNTGSYPFG